jgi:hypothetical protein
MRKNIGPRCLSAGLRMTERLMSRAIVPIGTGAKISVFGLAAKLNRAVWRGVWKLTRDANARAPKWR